MGNDTSLPLPQISPGFPLMCISLQNSDGVTLLHHDSGTQATVVQAVENTWSNGIQRQMTICGSGHTIKLKGNPFYPLSSATSALEARQMIAAILQKLYSIGWKISISADVGRYRDTSTIFFQKSPTTFSSTTPFVGVGLSSTDKLQIINLPSQLIEPLKQVISQYWGKGVQNESYVNDVLEIKLNGNPWYAADAQSVMAKNLLQNIIAMLRRYQWIYTVNVNIKGTADTLYFRYDSEVVPNEPAEFCTISLNRTDRIRLMNVPEQIVNMIRGVIQNVWSHGKIQEEKDHHGSWEFKISGNPWCSSREESVMARFLVLKLLEAMLEYGWHNVAAIDICRRATDKSVFIFQKREPKHCSFMCLSLNDNDKIRLINMPEDCVQVFKKELFSRWYKGIQEEKVMNLSFGAVYQLKLKGWPWNGGMNNDTYHIRSFLCKILQEFIALGWKVLMAGDVSAKYVHQDKDVDYPVDVHSFWFIHDPTPTPTAPQYGFTSLAPPQSYGVGATGYGVPPATTLYPPRYGPPPSTIYPHIADPPPPSYHQVTGWNTPAENDEQE